MFSSIVAFQQAIAPMRCSYDPPSRTVPAFSSSWPFGALMSFSAGLPSIQYAHSYASIFALAVSSTAL